MGYGIALMHKCDVRIGLLDCAKDTICGGKSVKLRHLQIIVWRYKIRIEINLSEENIMSEQYEFNKNLARMLNGIQEAVSIPVMAKCRRGIQ